MRRSPSIRGAACGIALSLFTLAGCGQKGPLTLPPAAAPAAAASQAAR
jgi:predicted small lipoprotein YifL